MGKKKTKIVSNRGFATTSAPSKKVEAPKPSSPLETTPEVASIEPVSNPKQESPFNDLQSNNNEQDTLEDPVTKLVKKYETLNNHKSQIAYDRLLKDDVQDPSDDRVRKFSLTAELEADLLAIVRQKESDMFKKFNRPLKNSSNEYDKTKIIGQFDVLYRTLIRLGFNDQDVNASFEATLSKSIEDHLDWLCINVPYERMPIGFFDKYFNENEKDHEITLLANKLDEQILSSDNNRQTLEENDPSVSFINVKDKKANEDQNEKQNDMKALILEAAQSYMDDEEEDINEKHTQARLKLMEMEKLLPTQSSEHKSKKANKHQVEELVKVELSGTELDKLKKDLKKLKEMIQSLEANWDFDKKQAEQLYRDRLKIISEQKKLKRIKEIQEMKKKQQQEEEEDKENKTTQSEDDDEDEGGLFGGLMDHVETNSTSESTSTLAINWNIVDLDVAKKWMGKNPKDILLDYCNKHKLGKQSFSANCVRSGVWRATAKISRDRFHESPLQFELPLEIASLSQQGAEELAALFSLFELDSTLSSYKVLSTVYKDLWETWAEEKRVKEEAPRLEADRKRLSFIVDLIDRSFSRRNSESNSLKFPSVDSVTSENAVTASKQNVLKKQKLFARVQQNFRDRLSSKEYQSIKAKRSDLPITAYRQDILNLVKNNQTLIISGETGCGKSTQVPQFLAEDLLEGSVEGGSVVCTQPRRISAMSIANRVSFEMGDRPKSTGSSDAMVGYQIRLESKMSAENVLLFCTTGILLRRLESDRYLNGVTHIIVDEVHERSIESDFLLIILRKLCAIRTDLKVILMSATVNASRFSQYFDNCPILSVPGRTYPVHVQYLEDVLEDTGYVLEEDSPFALKQFRIKTEKGSISVSGQGGSSKRVNYEIFEEDSDEDDPYDPTRIESKLTIQDNREDEDEEDSENRARTYSRQTRKMIKRMDDKKINYDLMLELLDYVCNPKKSLTEQEKDEEKKSQLASQGFIVPDTGAILVFLPGINEIRKLFDLVSSHNVFGNPKKYLLIALHSTLSSEHQEKAFEIPPEGIRKIVFSTNIAETGVTISDVTVVIDTGMAKVISYDDKNRVTRLLQKYVAKANARQRRGRAGRVQEGVCFHLFTQKKYEDEMADYETPEILRLPLEELCLRIKVCELGGIRDILGAALDPPTQKMIDNAILTLQEVQALSMDDSETLTPLGVHLSNLPVDVHIGKMILFGAIFRCLDPILTIAAALSYKSPFIRPFGKEDEADAARSRFHVENSDFLTIYNAYCAWREQLSQLQSSGASTSSIYRKLHQFCKLNFLSEQNLEMIEDMKRQYLSLLVNIGFVKIDKADMKEFNRYDTKRSIKMCKMPNEYNQYCDSLPVIGAALTAGLYPKIADYSKKLGQITNNTLNLQIHPSSVMFKKEKTLVSDFLVYNTVVMNNNNALSKDKAYMWELSSIDAVAVILLATGLDIKYKQRRMILDNWIFFDCFARTAVLLKFLRQELNNWLAAKMDQPDLDLGQYNNEVMDLLVKTLEGNTSY